MSLNALNKTAAAFRKDAFDVKSFDVAPLGYKGAARVVIDTPDGARIVLNIGAEAKCESIEIDRVSRDFDPDADSIEFSRWEVAFDHAANFQDIWNECRRDREILAEVY